MNQHELQEWTKQVKETVVSVFGRTAQQYVSSVSHAHGDDLKRMVAYAQVTGDELLLDIATGGGHVACEFAPLVRQVVALDMTQPMLAAAKAHAKTRGLDHLLFVAGDAEALPFADKSFDRVTCRIAPHHFANPERFVQEVARVLKAGGRFVLTDNIAPEDAAAATFINEVEKLRDVSHVCCYSVAQWHRWLAAAGLHICHEEKWAKPFAYEPWVNRTADTPEQIAAVTAKLNSTTPELATLFAIERAGHEVRSFQIFQWLAICMTEPVAETSVANRAEPSTIAVQDSSIVVSGLDHIQVAAPVGCEDAARAFYGQLLGLKEIIKPAQLQARGGVWFACGHGQLHVGVEQNFTSAQKAHPAFGIRQFDAMLDRLQAAAKPIRREDLPGLRRAFSVDPFGNRIELVEWTADASAL